MNEKARAYFKALTRKERLGLLKRVGITESWLKKMIYTGAKCSPVTAKQLEQATGGVISRVDIRPDLKWGFLD